MTEREMPSSLWLARWKSHFKEYIKNKKENLNQKGDATLVGLININCLSLSLSNSSVFSLSLSDQTKYWPWVFKWLIHNQDGTWETRHLQCPVLLLLHNLFFLSYGTRSTLRKRKKKASPSLTTPPSSVTRNCKKTIAIFLSSSSHYSREECWNGHGTHHHKGKKKKINKK